MMQGGGSRDRERFPDLGERLGEDPARWLDWPILGNRDRERFVKTRIESIDRVAVLRAWKAVERRLGRGESGGPRSGIIDALDEREAVLDEIGERPDRLEARDEPRNLGPVETSWPDRPDVDEPGDRAVYSRPRRFGPGEAVATDGGRCER
ncbi:hypothetical protein OB920_05310 [Halobacteria archaeon HArc-gm2]|nr:hypothetical protein [Halobacteria archaeon HArc-gm2]